ncbi:hypothetical protein XENORESO_010284 [Xenotaenia resolanae]|uniref:Uncharacterized protein n=1 Tax=Xenotaenia resolanae TaxID=208358 RepID=A0ABV0W2A9_9TELE
MNSLGEQERGKKRRRKREKEREGGALGNIVRISSSQRRRRWRGRRSKRTGDHGGVGGEDSFCHIKSVMTISLFLVICCFDVEKRKPCDQGDPPAAVGPAPDFIKKNCL